ncbi:hypothetical protein D7Y23_25625 [Corallococcus sp. AB050B]|nr:hypothetical protein D7Y23_25625 [Corallococcus sp. AB050B]
MAVNVSRFHERFTYQARAPVPALLEDLEVLSRLDARAEGQRRVLSRAGGTAAILGGALALLCRQVWAGAVDPTEGLGVISGAILITGGVGGAAFVVGIGLLVWRALLRKRDLDNRRYDLARVLLQRLQVDLAPKAPVRLKLDLRAPDEPDKHAGQGMVGEWSTEFFVDPWFSLETRLADGTFVRIRMVERFQKRKRTRTTVSFLRIQRKTKGKHKSCAVLDVSARVKPERYPGLEQLKARATGAVRLPPRVQLSRVRLAADRLSLRARLSGEWVARAERAEALEKEDASRTATMMLLSLYQVLGYARRRAKRQAARGRLEPV